MTTETPALLPLADHVGIRLDDYQRDSILSRRSGERRIAVLGTFSSGKSRLVNRLVGTTCVPSQALPTTLPPISVSNGRPSCEELVGDQWIAVPMQLPVRAVQHKKARAIRLSLGCRLPLGVTIIDTRGTLQPTLDEPTDWQVLRPTGALFLLVAPPGPSADHVRLIEEARRRCGGELRLLLNALDSDRDAENVAAWLRQAEDLFGQTPIVLQPKAARGPWGSDPQWRDVESSIEELGAGRPDKAWHDLDGRIASKLGRSPSDDVLRCARTHGEAGFRDAPRTLKALREGAMNRAESPPRTALAIEARLQLGDPAADAPRLAALMLQPARSNVGEVPLAALGAALPRHVILEALLHAGAPSVAALRSLLRSPHQQVRTCAAGRLIRPVGAASRELLEEIALLDLGEPSARAWDELRRRYLLKVYCIFNRRIRGASKPILEIEDVSAQLAKTAGRPSIDPQLVAAADGASLVLKGQAQVVLDDVIEGGQRAERRRLWELGAFGAVGLVFLGLAGIDPQTQPAATLHVCSVLAGLACLVVLGYRVVSVTLGRIYLRGLPDELRTPPELRPVVDRMPHHADR